MCDALDARERRADEQREIPRHEGAQQDRVREPRSDDHAPDQALLELKRKMGVLPPASSDKAKQLGRGAGDVHEAELVDDTGQADGTTHG